MSPGIQLNCIATWSLYGKHYTFAKLQYDLLQVEKNDDNNHNEDEDQATTYNKTQISFRCLVGFFINYKVINHLHFHLFLSKPQPAQSASNFRKTDNNIYNLNIIMVLLVSMDFYINSKSNYYSLSIKE